MRFDAHSDRSTRVAVMLRQAVILVVALTVATAANANGARALEARFHGQPYASVRPRLLEMGYRAINFPHNGDSGCTLRGVCKEYPESYACSGTGLAYCLFALSSKSGHGYLVIQTVGETKFAVDAIRTANPGDRTNIAMALKGL